MNGWRVTKSNRNMQRQKQTNKKEQTHTTERNDKYVFLEYLVTGLNTLYMRNGSIDQETHL